jgi:hypothetical protein
VDGCPAAAAGSLMLFLTIVAAILTAAIIWRSLWLIGLLVIAIAILVAIYA